MKTISIPKCHDFKLIKGGNKNPEGSIEFEKENIIPAIETANEVPEMAERLTICFRAKDEKGWYIAIGVTALDDLKPGDEIIFKTNKMHKLVVQ